MRTTSYLLLLILHLCAPAIAFAQTGQLSGHLTDPAGEPLPFASIYIQNSTIGTTSNVEGDYILTLDPGTYQVVFQYLGFETQVIQVTITPQPNTLDVVLEEEAVLLSTVVVRPDAEDPAYGIIRKAIEKRKFYLEQVPAYSCKVYIKGGLKILGAPEKIFGQEIGDMAGILDTTTRQGILYLSESESVWNVQRPNKYKEVMVSSKVSGNSQGFSFNSASDVNFDLYENTTDYSRPIVSPIAYNAMNFYAYKLVGTIFDEASRMIYKIQLEPKQGELPAYGGFIYILDGSFNIQGVDVFVTGASLNQPILDTLFLKQVHVPVQKDTWRLFSQTLGVKGDILGFKFGGDFTSIYRNYDLNPVFPKGFFDNEFFKVEEGANEKGLTHFDTIRPLPLTLEESVDYHRRDSLQLVQESKPYMDSLDHESNKFTSTSLLLGYTYSRSYKKESFTLESPLMSIQFHTVHGWNGTLGLRYRKGFDRYNTRRLETGLKVMYGLSENRPRVSGDFAYQFNRTHFSRIRLSGGVEAPQFNAESPISPSLNSAYTLWVKRNYSKVYNKVFRPHRWPP
ncbi:MAG: carboxypeptidase-like regulatory domain-containing protein [Saprospirales bacterium]|nr:carboxypeptidase-like regulatory domain-containing protein [Saprospirales bacterium]